MRVRFASALASLAALALFAAASPAWCADTVAVLPLFNINASTAPDLNWIGESVAETVHETLSAYGMLTLSRDDRVEVYRRMGVRAEVVLTRATVMKLGQTLDAGQVVFGDYTIDPAAFASQSIKAPIHIVAHVIDLRKFKEAESFEQNGILENLSQLEMSLAWQVLHQMEPDSAPSEEMFRREHPAIRVGAMESYVRGLMTPASNTDLRVKFFTQAANLDDRFSQPNYELGQILFARKDYPGAAGWFSKVTRPDSHYMEASFLLGICRYYEGNFDEAIRLFRMVADEVPLNEVFNNLAAALSRRNDAAAAEGFHKALEGDEGDPDYWFNYGYALWKLGQYAKAADQFRAALQRSPTDTEATSFLGRCLRNDPWKAGDPRTDGRERIKTLFEDSAYRQLRAELKKK
ncbi:MAG TPA: tetratricopeptide repeat protein [Bryobacteraceae bacterium]|nr:tetratricopeptide repeat protein [Bryobacteraceae bacterium]